MKSSQVIPPGAGGRRITAWALCLMLSTMLGCRRPTGGEGPSAPPEQRLDSNTTSVAPGEPPESAPPGESVPVPRPPDQAQAAREATPDDANQAEREDQTAEPTQAELPPSGGKTPHAESTWAAGQVWQPRVVMSQSHAATCLAAVGDRLPAVELPDLSGTSRRLDDLLGSQATVVVFWNSRLAYAREQYLRLVGEVVQPFGSLGVNVVAINVGDEPDVVRELAKGSAGRLTDLLDVDHSVFGRIATAKLPRTYLLDAAGKILWLDIEYSRATRRELANAIRYYLKLQG